MLALKIKEQKNTGVPFSIPFFGCPVLHPLTIHEIFWKIESFTKITLVKLIFGLAKRDWYQILRKSILFSYNITNNTLGEGQNWSKFKISGHFGQKNRISEWVGGVSERNFFFCPFLKNFCPFYSNHLTIP